MTQWTAVEWLFERLTARMGGSIQAYRSTFEMAREMEKKQIIDAWDNGCEDDGIIDNAEQYYNETFNK